MISQVMVYFKLIAIIGVQVRKKILYMNATFHILDYSIVEQILNARNKYISNKVRQHGRHIKSKVVNIAIICIRTGINLTVEIITVYIHIR